MFMIKKSLTLLILTNYLLFIPVCIKCSLVESVQRKLDWVFTNYIVKGDKWYYDYWEWEYDEGLEDPSSEGADSLMGYDICPGKDGSFKLSNCPTPPKCNEEVEDLLFGSPKLCINRAPLPWDTDTYYVVAMKCIPFWEGCDSCLCGNLKWMAKILQVQRRLYEYS